MPIRFLTSGESHGKCLNAIIEGIPAGFELDFDFINNELANRQKGYGRGGRMKIETDRLKLNSGVRFGVTTGAPICLEIENKDWENWLIPMSTTPVDENLHAQILKEKEIGVYRPGHADFAGTIKYNHQNIRNILERSSARETATRVAVGAIAQNILKKFNIIGTAICISVGSKTNGNAIKEEIDNAKHNGVSLGGEIQVKFKNLPVGLGSFTHWDRRLDGLLAQAIMSIPAIKSVEIGLGKNSANLTGDKVHDELFFENEKFIRKTNNAGGLEGGMTNGEEVVITAAMKPIPTMKTPLKSVNLKTKEETAAHFERADTCAVEAAATVALNMASIVLLNAFLERFGCDNYEQIKSNYEKK